MPKRKRENGCVKKREIYKSILPFNHMTVCITIFWLNGTRFIYMQTNWFHGASGYGFVLKLIHIHATWPNASFTFCFIQRIIQLTRSRGVNDIVSNRWDTNKRTRSAEITFYSMNNGVAGDGDGIVYTWAVWEKESTPLLKLTSISF